MSVGVKSDPAVYSDDVVIYRVRGEFSLYEELTGSLSDAQLSGTLAKCELANAAVVYQGNVVGQGKVFAVLAKVSTM